jgi:hypothetical protein
MFGHSIFNRKHADKMMEAVRRKIQNAPKAKKKLDPAKNVGYIDRSNRDDCSFTESEPETTLGGGMPVPDTQQVRPPGYRPPS